MRILLLTSAAMLAFAANSLLCRLALGTELVDAASFTSLRVLSGAIMLLLLCLPRWRLSRPAAPDWRAVMALYTYMICFSFAYLSLSAGTGALILFGAVQLTMFVAALRGGEHFSRLSWLGLSLALAGLVYLVLPGVTAPDPQGALLMAVAGFAWGAYSLLGRGAGDPLDVTAGNFLYCVPLAILTTIIFLDRFSITPAGALLAVGSGALASALGYYLWYAALGSLGAARAATVQLSVPVLAALGGVLLLDELITARLLLASVVTLGGVAMVLWQGRRG